LENVGKCWKIWKMLENSENFEKCGKFWTIFKKLENLENFGKLWKIRIIDTCFGLSYSTLICGVLSAMFLITIDELKCSKAISGLDWDWDWIGLGLGLEISVGTDSKSTALQC